MQELSAIFNLIIPLILLFLGYWIGSLKEKRHYASIVKREKSLIKMAVVTFDDADDETPTDMTHCIDAKFVSGSVVVSVDYFKRFIAGLRNIFGGRVSSYETLLDRGRREAILRMKEAAPGASGVANLRVETSTLGSGKGLAAVEVHAYGTALYFDTPELSRF